MTENYFIDLKNMVDDSVTPEDRRGTLDALVQPWLPADTKIIGRLVRSEFHAVGPIDYVIFTDTSVYFVLVEVLDSDSYRYELRSIKCFMASDLIAYAFLLGSSPEIRLMLSAGKRIKLRLDTTLNNSDEIHPAFMQKLANSKFLTQRQ